MQKKHDELRIKTAMRTSRYPVSPSKDRGAWDLIVDLLHTYDLRHRRGQARCDGGAQGRVGRRSGEPRASERSEILICVGCDRELLSAAGALKDAAPDTIIANHEALKLLSADNYRLRTWKMSTIAWAEDHMEIVQQRAADRGLALPQAGLNGELCRLLKPKRFRLEDYGVKAGSAAERQNLWTLA